MRNKFFRKITPPFFLLLILSLIVSTLIPAEVAGKYFYRAPWFGLLWLILAVILAAKTIDFLKRRIFNFALINLGLFLIIAAGFLSSLLGQEGFIEIQNGQTVKGFWIEDDLFKPLDFSLTLKDFSVEYYPDTEKKMKFVKSYKSKVVLNRDNRILKEGVIEVNRPLKFEGFWFYQYAYDPKSPGQTLLQVVKDPGLVFVYAGFLLFLTGLLLSFRRIFLYR